MATVNDLNTDVLARGLMVGFRTELRKQILEAIEPDIKAAIDAACERIQLSLNTERSAMRCRDEVYIRWMIDGTERTLNEKK